MDITNVSLQEGDNLLSHNFESIFLRIFYRIGIYPLKEHAYSQRTSTSTPFSATVYIPCRQYPFIIFINIYITWMALYIYTHVWQLFHQASANLRNLKDWYVPIDLVEKQPQDREIINN